MKKKKLIAVAVVSLIALTLTIPPVYTLFKQWRVGYLISQSKELREEGKIDKAWLKASTAYKLMPDNVEALRAVAYAYEQMDPSRSLGFWLNAYEGSGDSNDLVHFFENAAKSKSWDMIGVQLSGLSSEEVQRDEILLVKAKFLTYRGQWIEVLPLMRNLLSRENPLPDAVLFYGYIGRFFPSEQRLAADLLLKLAIENPSLCGDAFTLLMELSVLSLDDLRDVSNLLKDVNQLGMTEELALIRYKGRFLHESKSPLLKEARSLFDLKQPDQQVLWGRWLNQMGWSDTFLDEVDLSDALKRQDLFLVWMDAMAIEDDWREILSVLNNESVPLDPYIEMLFKARAYKELGMSKEESIAWDRSFAFAGNDVDKILYILDYAFKLDKTTEIRKAFQRLAQIPSVMRQTLYQWLFWEKENRETEKILNVLDQLFRLNRRDPAIVNDRMYVALLLNLANEDLLRRARQMVIDDKPYLAQRITLALAYYRNNDFEAAYRTLEPLNIERYPLYPGHKAVYAAVLYKNGKYDEAMRIKAEIPLNQLLREERILLQAID